MNEDFSATLLTIDLCRTAELLRKIYDFPPELGNALDPEEWDAVYNVLERLRPLQSYGSAVHQAEEVLKRVMADSVG